MLEGDGEVTLVPLALPVAVRVGVLERVPDEVEVLVRVSEGEDVADTDGV